MHTCVHSYSEECHDTFVTTYEPHQEEECDEKFRKTCTIWNEDVALNEEVEVCNTRYRHPDLPGLDSSEKVKVVECQL